MVALLQLIYKICTCIPIPTNMNEASQQHSQYQFKPPPARTSFYRWVCDKCVPASVFEESEENEEEEKSLANVSPPHSGHPRIPATSLNLTASCTTQLQ
jgi:hypothetical protein